MTGREWGPHLQFDFANFQNFVIEHGENETKNRRKMILYFLGGKMKFYWEKGQSTARALKHCETFRD
jgi:hypothetical protein